MNSNKSTNSSIPLFYIIQPEIKIKQTEQNMQEIFHNKVLMNEVEEPKTEENLESQNVKEEDLIMEEPVEHSISAELEDPILVEETTQDEADEEMDSYEDFQEDIEKEDIENQKRDLRMKLIRLARYPAVVQKPLCELIINGETIIGQIESKRGEFIKIKTVEEIRFFEINQIEDITIM